MFDKRTLRGILFGIVIAVPLGAFAGSVDIPHQFEPAEIISSSEMNDNFTAIKTAVDDNHARLSALEAGGFVFSGCQWRVSSNSSNGVAQVGGTCPAGQKLVSFHCSPGNAVDETQLIEQNGGVFGIDTNNISAQNVDQVVCSFSSTSATKRARALCCPDASP